ncbi:Fe-S-containing hydro-lyase [Desulfovibrio sp. ZJ369]|uniref:Fe-S-containing hydro-lyase n=1 Tax=Desulfovibrio sp. ZJ369 TaxID=2709793 RepID=UPI0013EA59E4|nr:Fe-S-containing hydro-lyase [Desulfovibrio sp. ZJ369]
MSEQPMRISAPFDDATARALKAGDHVLISGTILAARDAAHKRMVEALDRGEELPVDLRGAVVYYVGPSPAKPGQAIGAAGPTTAGRMDAYTPRLLDQGLKGMIGKGYRTPEVVDAMKKHGVPYLAAVGGAGALISGCIKKYTVLAYADLGPEAVAAMEVEDFPAIVAIDAEGNDYYEQGQAPYRRLGETAHGR